ncbi:CaiB/BaiF CoA-transferase family protein [Burkholderia vietnamiensis]|uniref:CaiB/BaiF CoA-transferase family protein n=1 Tax=Burkholderia vietnamiensis TaxID=60552 RepID=A0AAW7SZD5_BURVI|nr:CaiB/BaiF CoA-transferase family protein [Burkholderia vietnamiensis]MBH9645870.1 CoA transferase [Burkholderia vietnamiensis]MBR8008821.1 CoA transferase [Burkholderia vietnamiensis]MDN7551320.1 CaiB/BaiF CoA-transferase family protein [Burkholderia vietnamiensis]MDN7795134.1 CaiB/BaiF CoA-transferase family protein [Burkholderia vietnamiensis]MDN8045140.1 CaiB/BaiF CoA-transferase family protein [Burkholderia vietnamiensis]
MTGPLQGIRIVEMAGLGPGPFAAMMLADMGAEVIRVQAKGAKSTMSVLNTRFDVLARGRRSMAIDLKKPEGREAVLQLIARADALIEGFRPGVMERLGLAPADCEPINPRLVYGRMTGWGQSGPLAHTAGHDINYLALTGVLHGIGPADGKPVVPLNVVADMGGGGMLLAFGVVCGLLEARRSGKGQVVDAAMTEGAALLAAMVYGFKAAGLWSNKRGVNLLDGGACFYDTYLCADGKALTVGALEPQFHTQLLLTLGLDAAEFPAPNDPAQWPRYKARLAQVFLTRSRDEWADLLASLDACVAPVLDWDEAPVHPHNRARGSYMEVAGVIQPGPAPRFSRTQPEVPCPPRAADQDTEDILRDWGLKPETIAALKLHGAID